MGSLLKHALLDHREPAYRVAMQMGISEVRLSKISSGLIKPRESEIKLLVTILNRPQETIFMA